MPPLTPEAQARIKSIVEHYQSPENKDYSRLLVDKSGNIVSDKDGNPTIQIFTTGEVKDTNDAEYTIDHYISTPRIDYVRDVMDPFGMDGTALEKNKSVFYNHCFSEQTSLPIGKNVWVRSDRNGVMACTKYAVNENPFAKDVYNLVKGGYLNSYSIGFKYDEFDILTISSLLQLIGNKFDIPNVNDYEPSDSVWYHKKWKCHEYSQVGVPMNQDAVRKSLRKALDANIITSLFGKNLFESVAERSIAVIPEQVKNDEPPITTPVPEPEVVPETKSIEESIQTVNQNVQTLTSYVNEIGLNLSQLGELLTAVNDKLDQVVTMCETMCEEEPAEEAPAGEAGMNQPAVEKAGEPTTINGNNLFDEIASGAISGVKGNK